MKLTNKAVWWFLWGIGGILWIIVLIQFVLADTDTVIVAPDNDKNSSSNTPIVKTGDSTVLVSPSDKDSVVKKNQAEAPSVDQEVSPPPSMPTKDCVNVNTAKKAELETLSGIGPVLAERIILFRQEHGNFAHASDLVKVKGIGQGKLKKIVDHICF